MQKQTYLLTGASGLVGSHVLTGLLHQGHHVKALIRSQESKKRIEQTMLYYIADVAEYMNQIEWVYGDVTDLYMLEEVVKNVDGVFHCAAVVSFDAKDKESVYKINVDGTANVVNALLHVNPSAKLCHVSSIATFGRVDEGDIVTEDTHWTGSDGNSSYSISKYLAENEVWRGSKEGLTVVVVNPSIIIGPGDWTKGSIALINLSWKGLQFYTRGSNGYVDVRDVADVMIKLMQSDIANDRFLLSAENISYKQFFTKIALALGKHPPQFFAGYVLSALAWRFELVRALLIGVSPIITKETARTANRKYVYSGDKIKRVISFNYRFLDDTIRETCVLFLKEKHEGI